MAKPPSTPECEPKGWPWPGVTDHVWPHGSDIALDVIRNTLCRLFDFDLDDILAHNKSDADLMKARDAMWYLTYCHTSLSYEELAAMWNRKRRGIIYGVKRARMNLQQHPTDVATITEVANQVMTITTRKAREL